MRVEQFGRRVRVAVRNRLGGQRRVKVVSRRRIHQLGGLGKIAGIEKLDVLQAFAAGDGWQIAIIAQEAHVFGSRGEGPPAENDQLALAYGDRHRKAVQAGVTGIFEAFAACKRAVVSAAAIGLTQRRVVRRNPHRLANAVVVFDTPDDCAVLTQGDERDTILIGQRTLQAQPYNQGVVGRRLVFGQGCSLYSFSGQAA